MNETLQGRDWTVWEQIDDVLGLALNRATTAYLDALNGSPEVATVWGGDWRTIVHDLAQAKALTAGMVANASEVPPNISQTPAYQQIEDALLPVAMWPEIQEAITTLPFIAANPEHAMASRNVFTDLGLDGKTGKTIAVALGAGLLGFGLYRWARGR